MKTLGIFALTALSLGLFAGCQNEAATKEAKLADNKIEAMCSIEPTKGNMAKGHVHFTQVGDNVMVVADIEGLAPDSKHGFHIHEGTECGEDGMKAGGHYNPEKHQHGKPGDANRHAGDLGNIEADKDGKAHLELTVDNITINAAKNPIVGHAMILHAKADDFGQPVGNAGPRIGCGIIKMK